MTQIWQAWGLIGWLLLSTATGAEDPAARQPALASANMVARITVVEGSMSVSPDLVEALLRSTAVLQAAAQGLTGLPSGWEESVRIRVGRIGEPTADGGAESQTLQLTVDFEAGAVAPAGRAQLAQQLLAGLSREFQKSMQEVGGRETRRLTELSAVAERASAEARQRFQELQTRRQQLLDAAGRSDLDRDRIADEQRAVETQLRDLDLRLVTLRARQTAFSEQIARLGKEVGTTVDSDPVVVELAKIAHLREQALARTKERQNANLISQQEADVQEEQLARARAELAGRRQAAAQIAGGDLLTGLNKELLQQSVELAAAEAERGALAARLAEMRQRKLLDLADQYEREVQMTLPAARAAFEDADSRYLRAVNNRNRYQPPQVVPVGPGQ